MKRHPVWFVLNLALTFGPALLNGTVKGAVVGFVRGIIGLYVGARASTTVEEIRRS